MARLAILILVSCLGLCSRAAGQSGDITTVAGGAIFTFPSNVTIAVNAPMGNVSSVALDSHGNVYVADSGDCQIFAINPSGMLQTVGATFCSNGIAVDSTGNVFVAAFNQIEKVSANGSITNVAGTGYCGFSGDGGPAASATLCAPSGIAVDASGNLFIADTHNNRIRKVSAAGIITTVAGNGAQGTFSGDGGPATSASLWSPTAVAIDTAGNLFIADDVNCRIRKVSPAGIISTVAGNGNAGYSGDGGPATSASLSLPAGVAVDSSGNLFIADSDNNVIRKVSAATGHISTVAGDGIVGFGGDGGPATSALLNYPVAVVLDGAGNLYIADYFNDRLRMVSASGIITTFAGNGNFRFGGDGGPATSASLNLPGAVAVDASGTLFIADTENNRIRAVSPAGIITTVAGNGSAGASGDDGPATSAQLFGPGDVAVDGSGNLYIADTENQRIRKVSTSGFITTVAGNGVSATCEPCGGFSGDGGQATSALLDGPAGVAVDASGNLFIADTYNNRVRKVSAAGIITTIAGSGPANTIGGSYGGDGGPASSAHLSAPQGVAVDTGGNVLIADTRNNRIRKVSASGTITTVAGNGVQGFSGDGGLATAATLNAPTGVAVDASGDLLIADNGNYRIRMVSAAGTITTVAGNGNSGFSGDGGPATAAALDSPNGVAAGVAGNFYIADTLNNRIRQASIQTSSSPSPVTVSPSSLSFSLLSGQSSTQEIAVTDPSGVPWSAAASTGWVTLTPAAGTGSGQFAVAANAGSLQPGTYSAAITVSNPLTSPAQETVNVSLTVTAPALSVGLASLSFASRQGGPTQSQSFQIGGMQGTPWQATATSGGGPWLSVSPPTGQVPASLTVNVAPGSLPPGGYQGTITIASPGSAPAMVMVGVELSVSPASAQGGIISTLVTLGARNVAADAFGNIFVADGNAQVWKLSPSGVVTVAAGNSTLGFSGDGGPATAALLTQPNGVATDASGDLFIADTGNNRVRKVSSNGIITTVAGNGTPGYSGDGGLASAALLNGPSAVAVDASGNLFIADTYNYEVRKISPDGIINSFAGGTGYDGALGDGGLATLAELFLPQGVAVDASGNLFIADTLDQRIRKVTASGIITTVAGGGNPGSGLGDGGPATGALLVQPSGVAVDASGNLFIADTGDNRIRRVSTGDVITTVAGDGNSAFSGDGGPATSAALNQPYGVALDSFGNLFIADTGNGRIREVSAAPAMLAISGVGNGGSFGQSFAPGMLMSVFGTGLSTSAPQSVTTVPLPLTSVSGTSATINGIPAPLLYISATQINLQIPYEVSVGSAVLTVTAGGQSGSISFAVQAAAPGIFVDSQNGHIVPNESAAAGSTIGMFLTGAGQVTPPEPTGNVPAQGTTPVPNLPVTMTVGGVSVTPIYIGVPNWSVGELQINFTVPSTLAAGTYPVVVTIGGVSSQAAQLTVTAP
jgi:uncharacterized protein (TIGR03437 family)